MHKNPQFLKFAEIVLKYFMVSVTLLVVAVPEGLPMSVTLSLALNMKRMLRTNNLVRKMHASETMGAITTICTDKTGTLTEGKPKLTHVLALDNQDEQELLKIAVAVESLSDHPLAKAIVMYGKERLNDEYVTEATDLEAILGKGVKATLLQDKIFIGNL